MRSQGLRVIVVGTTCEYASQVDAHNRAAELAAARVPHEMEFYDLPGECDAQRANRLTTELRLAKEKIQRLEAAAKPKRKPKMKKRAKKAKKR